MEIKNARIESTMLGFEDHGIMTFSLGLDYGDSVQSAGGYSIKCLRGIECIAEVLNIIGVNTWEELKGKTLRVKCEYDKVYAVGHFLQEKWLDFGNFFNKPL